MNIYDRFQSMGLIQENSHTFSYSDEYSKIKFKRLSTTDEGTIIPLLSVWSGKPGENEEFIFSGIVSLLYDFVGNKTVIDKIKEAIGDTGSPVFREFPIFNEPFYTTMNNEILISNPNTIAEIGTVYPHVSIKNSYNGKRGVEVSFGISFIDNDGDRHSFSFRHKLVTLKQIHSQNSKARLTSAIGNFVEVISTNIVGFIQENFNKPINEDALLSTLDVIEKVGMRRRRIIADEISEILKNKPNLSCWDLFLAITKFSTYEKNLNAKLLLEDIIEATVTIPVAMMNSIEELNATNRVAR